MRELWSDSIYAAWRSGAEVRLLSANREGEAARLVKERLAIDPSVQPEAVFTEPRT